jgi:hypothetical protein
MVVDKVPAGQLYLPGLASLLARTLHKDTKDYHRIYMRVMDMGEAYLRRKAVND